MHRLRANGKCARYFRSSTREHVRKIFTVLAIVQKLANTGKDNNNGQQISRETFLRLPLEIAT